MSSLCTAWKRKPRRSDVRVQDNRVLIDRVEGGRRPQYSLPIGERLPLYPGAAGKVLLGFDDNVDITTLADRLQPVTFANGTTRPAHDRRPRPSDLITNAPKQAPRPRIRPSKVIAKALSAGFHLAVHPAHAWLTCWRVGRVAGQSAKSERDHLLDRRLANRGFRPSSPFPLRLRPRGHVVGSEVQ